MKTTAKNLLTLALCLLLLGAVMLPAIATEITCSKIISIDIEGTGEYDENSHNEILLFTVVTTPDVLFLYFDNGKFEPYLTEFKQVGSTTEGNLIWKQTRVWGTAHNLLEIIWNEENGERHVQWQEFDYPERTPQTQPESVCSWCGKIHGGGFDVIIAWIHSLLAKIFGARY